MTKLIGGLSALTGWRRALAAFLAGAAAALAQAPFYFLPLLAVGFSALLLLVDGARLAPRPARSGFVSGWFFGFGYFLVGLYWVAYSFLVQAEEFAWMAPIAVCGLPAFLALFTGGAAALAAKSKASGWRRVFALSFAVMLAEYARGHVLSGLPWNLPGQALAGSAVGAQSAAIWGVYGLSLAALLLAMAPAALASGGARGLLKGAAIALAGTLALYGAGAARLAMVNPGEYSDVFVRIVQPNIPQREKIDNDFWQQNYERQIDLSAAPGPSSGKLFILWPENAVPVIDEVKEGLDALSARLPKNAVLIAGAVRRITGVAGPTLYYNSISVIAETDAGRAPVAHYDKHHLVPFGEYLPLYGVLKKVGLSELTPYGDDGFTPGAGPKTIRTAGGPAFAPLVCYEAIFPGKVYPKGDRPDWIATVTNDSWFGDSSGPRQHFDQARLRAIETGLPMARSANSGVSGLFDALGREIARVPLYKAGVIDAALPRSLKETLYDRFGDLAFFLMMAGAGFFGFFSNRTRR
ncbi:MAG: apolipoprotein N-acyltransferase [Pseudomonadota bacterium]